MTELHGNQPSIAERDWRAEGEEEKEKKEPKSENLELKLLESRTIIVEGPVNDKMYRAVVARLLYLEQKDPQSEITVFVNSPGGSADSGFGIYDAMKFVSCSVRTICNGLCASAGVLIYLGGTKGRRFTLPNSRFLLHQPSTSAMGQASDMEITAQEILRTRKRYAAIVAQEIGSNTEKVQNDSNRDFWLSAEDSVKYGLVDKITVTRADAK
ncbi:MAG TPA: ATP-dependent Clp protease proteolytic subunit [Planctomycetota bacterium]|nr:ATP-dependent Clp protease proteolytic subunit [Planctomycetota bacterium]